MPANAVGRAYPTDEFVTLDNVRCHLEFHSTCNNQDGMFDDRLDQECLRLYGCHFDTIKSIWISRLGRLDDYWHTVRMVKM